MSTPAAITRALDDLKELLRQGIITLPQWRDEVAALVRLERQLRQPPPPPPLPPPIPPKPPRQAPPPPPRPTAAAVAAAAAAARARALTDADVDEVLANAGWGPEAAQGQAPLHWRVVRTFGNAQQMRLRDSKLDVPADYPSAEDPRQLAVEVEPLTVERLAADSAEFHGMKARLGMTVRVVKMAPRPVGADVDYEYEVIQEDVITRWGVTTPILAGATADDLRAFVRGSVAHIEELLEQFTQNGSNWVIDRVLSLSLQLDRWRPLRGASYLPSPAWIVAKKCCVNVRNRDQDCFRYALTAAVDRPARNSERPAYYDADARRSLFDLSGIEMPARCCRATFQRFERQNPAFSLTVLECPTDSKGRDDLQPVYVGDGTGQRLTLLLLYDSAARGHQHYITVTSLPALLRGVARNEEAHCLRCLYTFAGVGAADRLAKHEPECRGIHGGGVQRIALPEPGENILRFKDFERKLRAPFAIYLDFESTLVPCVKPGPSAQRERAGAATERLTSHRANSFNARVVGPDGSLRQEIHYRGENAARVCLERLLEVGSELRYELQAHRDRLALSPEDEAAWRAAEVCHLCGEGGLTPWAAGEKKPRATDKVRDHCHVTGAYRGAAHSRCNLKARTCYDVSVFVHNLKGYDSHLLFREMESLVGDGVPLNVIATNSEKYISFKLGNLVFKDTLQFLQSSLDGLVKNLPESDLKHTGRLAAEVGVDLALLRRKGVYPYQWLDDEKKFADASLPPIEAFHNDLDDEPCPPGDYEHARRVWEAARCRTFADYHDLYLRLDVALLTDVFESFRSSAHATYGLDPAHYYTLPGFSWDALFKHTGVRLELLTDPDMYIACEKALRGGVCAVSLRHAKANNPQVAGYDPQKPTTWLRYDDANNLYGWAMSQCLPARGFAWGDAAAWDAARVLALADDDERGAFLEVDLEYPAELHESHNDFPLCPERMEVPEAWLSPYASGVVGSKYTSCEKLVPNLRDKSRYWIHYRNLKFAINHGLRLKAVHRVLEFEQEPWMKSYIEFNTRMRTAAKSDFEKDLYKLMNNAVFGKTMENLRARRDIQVLKVNSRSWTRWVASPSYVERKNITDGFVIAERARKKLLLNKPVYVGAAVLDLSKLHMWGFWYDELRPAYPNARLCYTDTDSLVYSVESAAEPDFHGRAGSSFDTSDYPKDHPMWSDDNKKVLGKFKDEAKGVPIAEFVGLRPKLYTIRLDGDKHASRGDKDLKLETKKSKGTKKSVVKKEIKFDHYLQTLTSGESMRHSQVNFRTDCHAIYTTRTTKISLSAFDSKRYLLADGITSLAYGHCAITAA